MAQGNCPSCGAYIPSPIAAHGMLREAMHSNRACPKCKRPLIWFTERELAGKWLIDDAEEQRQKRSDD